MGANATHLTSHGSTDRWDNEGGHLRPETQSSDALQSDLKKLGITPVQMTVFDCGGYRYSNLRDAIAAAKRLPRSA